ncbi:hypothetical protein ACXZ1M_25410 [Duganella sp. PWIR1]
MQSLCQLKQGRPADLRTKVLHQAPYWCTPIIFLSDRGNKKLYRRAQNPCVVKKCRTAKYFSDFYAAKSFTTFSKSAFFSVDE